MLKPRNWHRVTRVANFHSTKIRHVSSKLPTYIGPFASPLDVVQQPRHNPRQHFHTSPPRRVTMPTSQEQAALVEQSKKKAATQAVNEHLQREFQHIGIGSGSTVVYVVEAIAAKGPEFTSSMVFYPTGEQSKDLIQGANLTLGDIQNLKSGVYLDVAFDGADEVDEDLNLIKGGGACLFQEKIVSTSARKFVCVADFRKKSDRLGANWKKGIPLEVLPMAVPMVLDALRQMGSINPQKRSGLPGKAGAIVTDNGMNIIDAPFPNLLLAKDSRESDHAKGIWTVDALADKLIKTVGIVEIGLFYGRNGLGGQKPVAAYFGMADGSVEVQKAA